MNQHRVGAAAEQLVAAHLLGKGHDVFMPTITQSRVDLIYTAGAESRRAQVKVGTRFKTRGKEYENVKLRVSGLNQNGGSRPYAPGEIDELWVLGTHLWCIPARVIIGRSMISLTSKDALNWTRKDYDCDEFIVMRGEWEKPIRTVLGIGG
ncbi:group I intron-associated PD-(D/E)XK endonuclease [Mesorhizobium sp. M8A.F.Ca.ET.021.01.1.1]|uniref:group I intron-associated PD-(D/E)XK endonuclease n=1 Tax=Mesorhizobium sp. M8A.F.Ca.ET.021.01.1.1 TaxID=2496757 RepID=UPI000FCA0D91|nr:group I intron-associated PD-(D/E)XK endonuclease [Mesorhizobium sp. M8A.F.Ca.ET.021.01.1.1]RUW57147.1 hypothetical protein EOA36_00760 [Mesorhizobium sp. M8A.F.Ca.ET.021.01.1.1]